MSLDPQNDRPALLGGQPLRPEGPPDWPLPDPATLELLAELARTGDWGRYHGPWAGRLSQRLAELHGCRHVHLTCSGTAAVELALRALSVGPGDSVCLSAYDFKANFTNVLYVGARPVLVDVRPDDWQLDVGRLDEGPVGCPVPKAIIASHLHGGFVDMPALRDWADRFGVAILEDACQATGAAVHGRPAGMWGDVGVLSFGGSKLLTAGRGGAILTNRDDAAQRLRLIDQRGNAAYPLSEMQCALLLPQVEQLAARHRRRAVAAEHILAGLAHLHWRPLRGGPLAGDPAFYKLGWQYVADAFAGLSRDQVAEAVRREGIALDSGFRALHRTHARSRFTTRGELTQAEAAEAGILTLHHPVLLGEERDWDQVVHAVERVQRFAPAIRAHFEQGGV